MTAPHPAVLVTLAGQVPGVDTGPGPDAARWTPPALTLAEFIALPALSPSGAKKILKAPALYRWEKDHPRPSTDALDRGKIVHGLLFGHGDPVEVLDFDSWRTAVTAESQRLRVPVIDMSETMPDTSFLDYEHLLTTPATQFTTQLGARLSALGW